MKISANAKKAICIGMLCSVSYLAVYFTKKILEAVSPEMINGGMTEEYIGSLFSAYFLAYAIGQLINGFIGDKIKAKYMIGFGLLFAGVTNLAFSYLTDFAYAALIAYALTGFFLSMIYGPMTKIVSENTEPIHATRCSLGYTAASFLGSPMAAGFAAIFAWQGVFVAGSAVLFLMSALCFIFFTLFEKKGYVKYNQFKREKQKGGVKILLKREIIRFSVISIVTGIIRTSVMGVLAQYFVDYLGYGENYKLVYTISSVVIATSSFFAVFLLERLKGNMNLTLLIAFVSSAAFFVAAVFVKVPVVNVVLVTAAIFASDIAATMLWSRYCPSLYDTGMVSGATGFLDFLSYMAGSVASALFPILTKSIDWNGLVFVWAGLMLVGIVVSYPWKRKSTGRGTKLEEIE